MSYDCVIRGATVIDGTGAPGRTADVALAGGRIAAVGRIDDRATEVIDADGLVVAPGVVDIHTHYDAQLFWDGTAAPSSLHGVTTVIGGNCGFSIAPLVPEQASYLAAMLARVEGIPLESLERGVPWNWRSFGDYLDRLENTVAVNAGFLVGHTALRRCVMGRDDARPATDAELDQIVELLRASLAEGALGFSSSLATSHNDADGRAVSSRFATPDELIRLAGVTGEYEGTNLEFIPTVAAFFSEQDMDLMTSMSIAANRPLNWNLLNVNTQLWDGSRQRLGAGDHARARGGRVVALTMPMSSTMRVNFVSGFVLDTFADWTDLFALPPEERLRQLASPERRARMRASVENSDSVLTRRVRDWGALVIGETFSPATKRYEGRTLAEIAGATGADPFELLLDIVVADELRTIIVMPPIGNDPESWKLRRQVWRDDRALIGGSDAGAHLDMIDTFVYATSMLGPNVRDGHVSLPEAVRLLTDAPARLYGLRDRGRVAEGWWADLIVFDPATVGPEPVQFRRDLPGGAGRLHAGASGIAHVLVNGIEIVAGGEPTGARPGVVLRSGRHTDSVRALATVPQS